MLFNRSLLLLLKQFIIIIIVKDKDQVKKF